MTGLTPATVCAMAASAAAARRPQDRNRGRSARALCGQGPRARTRSCPLALLPGRAQPVADARRARPSRDIVVLAGPRPGRRWPPAGSRLCRAPGSAQPGCGADCGCRSGRRDRRLHLDLQHRQRPGLQTERHRRFPVGDADSPARRPRFLGHLAVLRPRAASRGLQRPSDRGLAHRATVAVSGGGPRRSGCQRDVRDRRIPRRR